MAVRVLDGAAVAAEVKAELRLRVDSLRERGVTPGLAVVLVGDNPASVSYVRGKTRGCAELGIMSETLRPDAAISAGALLTLIADLNADPRFHGILVQLPLPDHLAERAIIEALAPEKDVDGLHPINQGLLLRGDGLMLPSTPSGIQQLLLRTGNDPSGRRVVICGRSMLVGKPLAAILMQKAPGANATVTICHTATPDLRDITRSADILIAAIGQDRMITGDMVRRGAVVIDVGINRIADRSRKSGTRLVGDVDFDSVSQVAGAITPVPGGVGPMTVTMLMANTVLAAERATLGYT
ncbi:MAG: bifunctional 5,10-methylenetetrahydrofolate dehydrogenase/5,10-methenyltetrahydrofolate cyclohydrolase [Dehalococcoidia bacterium]